MLDFGTRDGAGFTLPVIRKEQWADGMMDTI